MTVCWLGVDFVADPSKVIAILITLSHACLQCSTMWALVSSLSCKGQDDLNRKFTCVWELLKYDECIVFVKHSFILPEVLEPEGGGGNCDAQGSPHSVCHFWYAWDHPHQCSLPGSHGQRHKTQARPRHLCPKAPSPTVSSQEADTDECSHSASFLHLYSPGYQQKMVPPIVDGSSHLS